MALLLTLSGCSLPIGEKAAPHYTLREAVDALPRCWSPLTIEGGTDELLLSLCSAPLFAQDAAHSPELAQRVTDVTATFGDRDAWKIGEEAGRVFRIALREDARWQDGTPVTSADFLYSVRALLDPAARFARAALFTEGDAALCGAADYAAAGLKVYTPWTIESEEAGTLFFPLRVKNSGYFRRSAAELASDGALDAALYGRLCAWADEAGFVPLNEDTEADLREAAAVVFASRGLTFHEELWRELFWLDTGEVQEEIPFSSVGLLAPDAHTLLYITASPVTADRLRETLCEYFLMQKAAGERFGDAYAASPAATVSCGPYRLVSLSEAEAVLVRSESWYGYGDGAHEGRYAADEIRLLVPSSQTDARRLFYAGKLDRLPLEEDALTELADSPYLCASPAGAVHQFLFSTDADALAALDAADGSSARLLSYTPFLRALSAAVDRTALCAAAEPPLVPLADGADPYDPTRARELFREAYRFAAADGVCGPDTQVVIRCMVSASGALSEADKRQETILNECIEAAAAGTEWEGRLRVAFLCGAQDRDADFAAGRIECIRTTRTASSSEDEDVFCLSFGETMRGTLVSPKLMPSDEAVWGVAFAMDDISYDAYLHRCGGELPQ